MRRPQDDKDEARFSPQAVLARLEPFMHASTPRALLSLGQTLLLYAVTWVLAYHTVSWSWLGFAASVCLLFACKMRLFVLFHDMGHGSFLPSLAWNRIVGHLIGSLNGVSFDSWKTPHSTHHVHLAKVDKNVKQAGEIPTWKTSTFAKASPLARFFYRVYRTPFFMFVVLPQYLFSLTYRWKRDGLLCNTLMAVRFSLVFMVNPALLWVEFWGSFIANSLGFFLFFGQHTFNPFMEQTHANYNVIKAGIYSSTFFVLDPISNWVTANIGYHHIHHATVRVPSYNLIQAHEATSDLWDDVTRVTVADVWRNTALVLWDDKLSKYVTFDEAHKNLALQTSQDSSSAHQDK